MTPLVSDALFARAGSSGPSGKGLRGVHGPLGFTDRTERVCWWQGFLLDGAASLPITTTLITWSIWRVWVMLRTWMGGKTCSMCPMTRPFPVDKLAHYVLKRSSSTWQR